MHFSLQNKPKNVFGNPWTIVILLILLLIVCVTAYTYGGAAFVYGILFVVISTTIAISVKLTKRKGIPEFDTTDQGIAVNGNLYPWSIIKYYSWYGDKQSERIGLLGVSILAYDPVNPFRFSKTQILTLHIGIGKNIRLQIDSDQRENLTNILNQYGVKRISMIRKVVGF